MSPCVMPSVECRSVSAGSVSSRYPSATSTPGTIAASAVASSRSERRLPVMNSATTVSSPVAGSRSTRAGRAKRSSSNIESRATRALMSASNAASSGWRCTRSSISPVSRSKERDLRPRPSMWPEDEIEEDERSDADADIAGTRTTLQPAHHLTGFVPSAGEPVFRVFQRVRAICVWMCAVGSDQIVTIDPNPVIERHSRARQAQTGSFVGRPVTICATWRVRDGEMR